jgi:arginine decarboxylase
MKPSDAFAMMAHREIERVSIDELEGRHRDSADTVSTGYSAADSGRAFNKTIVDYLRFVRTFNDRFPGFETDCHGLVKAEVDGKRGYFVDCVKAA